MLNSLKALVLLLAAALPLAGPPAARAGCHTVYRSYGHGYGYAYTPKVYEPYPVIPVAVFAPLSVSLTGAVAVAPAPVAVKPATAPALAPDAVQTLMNELRGLKAQMNQMRRGAPTPPAAATPTPTPQTAPQPAADPADALRQWQTSCGACHREDVAAKEGGGFVLLKNDGSRADLTYDQLQLTIKHIIDNTMPKVPNKHGIKKLTDQQATTLLEDITNFKQKPPPETPGTGGGLLIRLGGGTTAGYYWDTADRPAAAPARRVIRRNKKEG